jgi:hypothetical protein
LTVTERVAVLIAHCPAVGVNVKTCVPGVDVLTVAGLQVPVIGGEFVELEGSVGAAEPSQIAGIGLNVGVTTGMPVMEMLCEFWQPIGVNT